MFVLALKKLEYEMGTAENEKVWVALAADFAYGPLSAVEIKQALIDGNLKDDSSVWKKGWTEWKQPKSIPLFSFECTKSVGKNDPLTAIPVPSAEAFQSIISPKVTVDDVGGNVTWDKRRIAIVGVSTLVAGAVGAAVAATWTSKNDKEKREEYARNLEYINPNNK
jgi:hypothetical protein